MDIFTEYDKIVAKHEIIKQELLNKQSKIELIKKDIEKFLKAKWIITEVTSNTQKEFKDKVESMVSLAIKPVWDRPFEFKLDFGEYRGKSGCRPIIMENGEEYIPKDDMGGSIQDLIGFALTIIARAMENPRPRNVFILDEPFSQVGELNKIVSQIVREICEDMKVQILAFTHEKALTDQAHKHFHITHNGKESLMEVK